MPQLVAHAQGTTSGCCCCCKAKHLLHVRIREKFIYIFGAPAEALFPLHLMPYPTFPTSHSASTPSCPPAACQHQRFVSSRMCGRSRLTNCRAVSLATPAWTHLPPCNLPLTPSTAAAPFPYPYSFPFCCPYSLAKPLASQPTRYLSFNTTHHHQQQQRQQLWQRLQSRQLRARLVEEAASYFIHGKWHKLHVNCDAVTWPAPA